MNRFLHTGYRNFIHVMLVLMCLASVHSAQSQQVTGLNNWSIFIDQGHSQYENMGLFGYTEAEKVLRVGLALRDMFLEQTDIKAVYTARLTDNDQISLEGRVSLANSIGADFYYSIHSDAGAPAINRTLMLYGGWKNNGNIIEKSPKGGAAYGAILDKDLSGTMRIPSSGNRADRDFRYPNETTHTQQAPYLYVNRYTSMISLLSEAGFHTNPTQQMLNMNADWKTIEALSAFRSFLEWHNIDRPAIGILTGIVKDMDTGLPMNDVTITTGDKTYVTDGYNSLFKKYSSNPEALRNGFFFIPDQQPQSTVSVKFEKEGYQTITVDHTIISNPNGRTAENLSFLDPLMISTTPAQVVEVLPAQELQNLLPATPLLFKFSRKMDRQSVEDAFSITPQANYSFRWINDFQLEINTSEFSYLTDYTIKIDGTIAKNSITSQWLDGNGDGTEGGDFLIEITTSDEDAEAPVLTDYWPSAHSPARITRPAIRLVYDEEIIESSISPLAIVVTAATLTEPVPGTISHHVVEGRSVLHFYPSVNLTSGINYTVTIAAGLSDKFENVSPENSFQFRITEQIITQTTIIDNFNTGLTGWWNPQQAGQTAGIVTELTSRTHNISVVNRAVASTGSMMLSYGWDPDYVGTTYIRQHIPSTATQNSNRFTIDHVLQVYIFGDGSGNQVRMMIRDGANQLETHQWVTLNWIGWKLVSWDLKNDPAFPWTGVGGNGVLDGTNFYMDGFHMRHVAGAKTTGAIYFDHLHFVKREAMVYPTVLFENWQDFPEFSNEVAPWIAISNNTDPTAEPLGFTFPGASSPFAFMVMDPSLTTPPVDETLPAVDGDKYIIAMQSQAGPDDKWLISPQLQANANTQLSFFARSAGTGSTMNERIVVYYSLDNSDAFIFDPNAFTPLSTGDFIEVPDQWTQYTWYLGDLAGKVYRFAIRYVSDDDYMLLLDKMEVKDAIPFTLTLSSNPGGAGTLTGGGKYVHNQLVTIQATANFGYIFSHWNDSEGNEVSKSSSHSFTMSAADMSLEAVFTQAPFNLSIKLSQEGAGSVTGSGAYFKDQPVQVEAIAAEGYIFEYWTNRDSDILSTDPIYTFTMPGYNYQITAQFKLTTATDPITGGALRIWPNPAGKVIYVESPAPVVSVKIMDMTGRTMVVAEPNTSGIHVGTLKSGFYLMHIQTVNERHIHKIQITN